MEREAEAPEGAKGLRAALPEVSHSLSDPIILKVDSDTCLYTTETAYIQNILWESHNWPGLSTVWPEIVSSVALDAVVWSALSRANMPVLNSDLQTFSSHLSGPRHPLPLSKSVLQLRTESPTNKRMCLPISIQAFLCSWDILGSLPLCSMEQLTRLEVLFTVSQVLYQRNSSTSQRSAGWK